MAFCCELLSVPLSGCQKSHTTVNSIRFVVVVEYVVDEAFKGTQALQLSTTKLKRFNQNEVENIEYQ
jgi:hypothetical protein